MTIITTLPSSLGASSGVASVSGSDADASLVGASHGPTPQRLRALLLIGCVASVVVAASLGEPAAGSHAHDPELAVLLRGMAAIKGAFVLAAIAVLFWRFGHAISNRAAGVYIAGTAVMAAASVLIWQLSSIPLAAVAFHTALFVVLITAARDDGVSLRVPRGTR